MQKVWMRFSLCAVCLMALALPVFAGQLDDRYLAAFAGRLPGNALEKALLVPATGAAGVVRSGTPLKHALSRDWNQLEPATQKVLAKQLALPSLSGSEIVALSPSGYFRVHFTTTGADAPQIYDTTVNGVVQHGLNFYTGLTSSADWATQVGKTLDDAFTFYQGLGYHMPPTNPYDVYLKSLAALGEYGETDDLKMVGTSGTGYPNASSSFIILDKDFTDSTFVNDPVRPGVTYTPIQSLQVTSVHEFHHAVQYGYNYYFDIWYAEATSTWFEGELYPAVAQNYDYLAGWFDNSTRQIDLPQSDPGFNSEAYGRWIFNRYLAQQHSAVAVRKFWEAIAPIAPINGQDIPMTPVLDSVLATSYGSSLGAELLGFSKLVYTRVWPTTTAVTGTDVSGDLGLIPTYLPTASYTSYPVNSAIPAPNAPSVTLPHFSFAYYRFVPTAGMTDLTITLAKASGIQAVLFKTSNGIISEVPVNSGGTSYTLSGFDGLSEAALLLVNTSDVDGQQANFSTDGSTQAVAATASTNASKSGCFIATAAYGSYLHPKVAQLRAFRDTYLLRNPAGRLFVKFYYWASPPLADLIARHETLKRATRLMLAPVFFAVEHGRIALWLICLGLGVPVLGKVWAVRAVRRRMTT